MTQQMIKCTIMRGGTSKAIVFHRNDLPKDPVLRDNLILRVFGSPDIRQIDGLGGADTLTSKLAIIGPSTREGCDVDYTFGQVRFDYPMIDYEANCGNISSLVGPFAIDEGLVNAVEPVTKIRINQVNTKKILIAEVKVEGNKAEVEGNYSVHGVPGTGSEIKLDFSDTAGAKTGKLLPTGNVIDILHVEDVGEFEVSIVDAANPTVFVRGKDFGMSCTESPLEIDSNKELLLNLEKLRCVAAEKIGLVNDRKIATKDSPTLPLLTLCEAPISYKDWATDEIIHESAMDFAARMIFSQVTHKTYAGTGTVCTVAASMIPGTIVNQVCRKDVINKGELRIGHPQGVILTEGRVEKINNEFVLKRAIFSRTARCLMKGYAFIPEYQNIN